MPKNKTIQQKVTLKEYTEKHNPLLSRRGHKMTEGYLYRLIREDIKGKSTRQLWFKYILEGDKQHIYILLDAPKKT